MPLADKQLTIAPGALTLVGPGVAGQLADQLRIHGWDRAFVVTDRGIVGAGLLDPIVASLTGASIDFEVFDEVDPNPTDRNVDAGLARLRSFGACAVVLVGGGSVMDCGKYLALAAPNTEGGGVDFAFNPGLDDNDAIDFATLMPARFPDMDPYPTVAIPTTSGTASETNGGGLITDTSTDRKLTFNHDGARPQVVLLDPTLTVGLPPVPTGTCGMDALVHAIECVSSTGATPYADAIAYGAIAMVASYLPRVMDDPADLEARAQLQLASHMAGVAFSSGPLLGLVHATGHPISGRLHQPHGQTLSTMLPHVMDFNLEVCAEVYQPVAVALGVADTSASVEANARAAIEGVRALAGAAGTDKSAAQLGVTDDLIPQLAQDALSDLIILTTPRHPTRAEVEALYVAAM